MKPDFGFCTDCSNTTFAEEVSQCPLFAEKSPLHIFSCSLSIPCELLSSSTNQISSSHGFGETEIKCAMYMYFTFHDWSQVLLCGGVQPKC